VRGPLRRPRVATYVLRHAGVPRSMRADVRRRFLGRPLRRPSRAGDDLGEREILHEDVVELVRHRSSASVADAGGRRVCSNLFRKARPLRLGTASGRVILGRCHGRAHVVLLVRPGASRTLTTFSPSPERFRRYTARRFGRRARSRSSHALHAPRPSEVRPIVGSSAAENLGGIPTSRRDAETALMKDNGCGQLESVQIMSGACSLSASTPGAACRISSVRLAGGAGGGEPMFGDGPRSRSSLCGSRGSPPVRAMIP